MKLPISGDAKGYAILLGAAVAGVVVLTLFFKKQVGAVAQGVGGIVSGNNAATEGTVYEGAGILGTLGSVFNSASGGALEGVGDWIGESIFDVFNKPYDPNNPNTPVLRKYNTIGAVRRPEDSPTAFVK